MMLISTRTFLPAFAVLCACLLAGCSTRLKLLENRIACTADKSEAHVISKWGLFSIGSQVAPADAAVICKP